MAKFFENLELVLIVGLALAVLIVAVPEFGLLGPPDAATSLNGVLQWLHVFFGITWIGLLYYFNFVQIPTMPTIPAELKPGVSKYIAPKALFYFRWGAAFTVLTGLLLAWSYGELVEALTLQPVCPTDRHRHVAGADHGLQRLGDHLAEPEEGAWDWSPADDAAKAKAAATAGMASRLNTLLSIPMLLAMTNAH